MTQDPQWPVIRKSLVDSINELIAVNKKLVGDQLVQMQNHHDALYGFRNDKGEWVDGIIKVVSDSEKRRKDLERTMGWAIYGVLMAIGVSVWNVAIKFWHFLSNKGV